MPQYNSEHLHQCVRNLFYQAKVDFATVRNKNLEHCISIVDQLLKNIYIDLR